MSIFKELNFQPNNASIYREALTHPSYSNENPGEKTYQRLEFLGDSVIEFLVTNYLFEKQNLNEAEMTNVRIMTVREETLVRAARDINLGKYIMVGKKTEITDKILEDVFEAIIGAMYIDKNEEALGNLMNETLFSYIESNSFEGVKDFKTELQEYIQMSKKETVQYKVISEEDQIWNVGVYFDNILLGTGSAKVKKKAEQQAAKEALEKLC